MKTLEINQMESLQGGNCTKETYVRRFWRNRYGWLVGSLGGLISGAIFQEMSINNDIGLA